MLSSGQPDKSFGTDGFLYLAARDPQFWNYPTSLELDAQGNIYLVIRLDSNTSRMLSVWRLNPKGALDTSFGEGGGVEWEVFGNDASREVTHTLFLDSKGFYTVFGDEIYDPSQRKLRPAICNQRFNLDGSIDKSFGTDGRHCFSY